MNAHNGEFIPHFGFICETVCKKMKSVHGILIALALMCVACHAQVKDYSGSVFFCLIDGDNNFVCY